MTSDLTPHERAHERAKTRKRAARLGLTLHSDFAPNNPYALSNANGVMTFGGLDEVADELRARKVHVFRKRRVQ
jgi:hypothetical protein